MIQLNYRDGKPIYEQIKEGLRRLIITGVIKKDEKLPSVREMASQMAINPNTIQRAMRELEAEGFIYSVPGKGSFANSVSEVDDGRKRSLVRQFEEAATELMYLGESEEELVSKLRGIFEKK